jgi:hypothetical protein
VSNLGGAEGKKPGGVVRGDREVPISFARDAVSGGCSVLPLSAIS